MKHAQLLALGTGLLNHKLELGTSMMEEVFAGVCLASFHVKKKVNNPLGKPSLKKHYSKTAQLHKNTQPLSSHFKKAADRDFRQAVPHYCTG